MSQSRSVAISALRAHLGKPEYKAPLRVIDDVKELLRCCYPSLRTDIAPVKLQEGNNKEWVVVSCANYAYQVSGPVKPARITFHPEGHLTFDVLGYVVYREEWISSVAPHTSLTGRLDCLLASSGYLLCPGVVNYHETYAPFIRFQPKNLRVWGFPSERHDASKCVMWHIPNNMHISKSSLLYDACFECKALYNELNVIKRRCENASPSRHDMWTEPGSNRPVKFLSPASQSKRIAKSSLERKRLKTALIQVDECNDVEIHGEQSRELAELVSIIQEKHGKDLEAIFTEANEVQKGAGEALHETWKKDMEGHTREFFEDQLKNTISSRGNRWSTITYRIALAIYARSPSAYEALRGFGILQLPCVSSLKAYTSFNVENPGFSEERLAFARKQYDEMIKEMKRDGRLPPLSEGFLIFDEVKVGAKIHYHAKTGKFLGLAMSSDQLGSLHDVYQSLTPEHRTAKTQYMLQYLWRCTTSNFDIIGPYFSMADRMKTKQLLATLLDTIALFHLYEFKVKAILGDGAGPNLSLFKHLTGFGSGAYGIQDPVNGSSIHEITPYFTNPYTGDKVFILMCPSHQLKNMIAALYSSPDRSKKFLLNQWTFGWTAIERMLQREMDRAKLGIRRKVPGLKESYVKRDIWTRLNVRPAKIMQQRYVLAELTEYLAEEKDVVSQRTLEYLTAVNKLFEEGFLSHDIVTSLDCPIIKSIDEGFSFLKNWLDHLLDQGLVATSPHQKSFLAWQTWDLMRICYYGFRSFCEEQLLKHPGYHISPLRANGSAVETLFSQLRHTSGGNLTAVSYAPSRGSLLTKRSIHGNKIKDDYRNSPLYIKESELPIKKRRPRQK